MTPESRTQTPYHPVGRATYTDDRLCHQAPGEIEGLPKPTRVGAVYGARMRLYNVSAIFENVPNVR